MIADGIEAVTLASALGHVAHGRGPEFLVKNLVTQALARSYLVRPVGQTQKQVALLGSDV